jgi:hypothetical protein
MASLPRFVVVLAILLLPSRLLSQVQETTQAPAPEAPAAAVVPCHAVESCAEDLCCDPSCCRPWWEAFCRLGDVSPCGPPRESVFIFGGLYTRGSMGDTLDVFNVTYDTGNVLAAIGYQRYHWTTGRFHWGWEIGLAGRFGDGESVEVWGGPTVRHEGIVFAERLILRPSLTAGLSAVTETMGHEHHREMTRKGDATFLFYLGPEFALSTTRYPNVEFFYRLQHRCGARRTLGGLSEGYNANVGGLRFRF